MLGLQSNGRAVVAMLLAVVVAGAGMPSSAAAAENDGPSMRERESWTREERVAYGQELWGEADDLEPATTAAVKPAVLPDPADLVGTTDWAEATAQSAADEVVDEGEARLALRGGAVAHARLGQLGVEVAAKDGAQHPRALDVRAIGTQQARAVGARVLLALEAPTSSRLDAPVEVTVDASALGDMGGDFWQRARVVQLPACALQTPQDPACTSGTELQGAVVDANSQTFSATIALQDDQEPVTARQSTAVATDTATESMTVVALTAGASGASGDWSATPLSPAASWDVSTQSGTFSWSYPMRVPPTPGGLLPEVALAYDSGSLDGRVASTNNQSGEVGDGWSLSAGGYVERKYVSCAQDTANVDGKSPNNADHKTGDLCWQDDNATLVLGGKANELIRDAESGQWRLKRDDNTKVEKLTGGWNADNNTEYWKVTTPDGTQYWFGRGKRTAADTALNSDWTVPVYGNHPGEPCYDATFADAVCDQAWRWNLDYVVDTSGNSMTLRWSREKNKYAHNNNAGGTSGYDAGGVLAQIDYGTRTGADVSTTPAARVLFDVGERCLASTGCDWDTAADNPGRWPDVPTDLICTGNSCPEVRSPAFFSHQRITSVTTQIQNSSGSWRNVDRWNLTHTMPDPGDGSNATLWLKSIEHVGVAGGTQVPLPLTTFTGQQMPNRVDARLDGRLAMNRYRLTSIRSESGAVTSIAYTGTECTPSSVPNAPATNAKRCMPVYWTPEGANYPELEYFHKYLVSTVTENAQSGGSDPVMTYYNYGGSPAWHYDDNPLVPKKNRTWGQWRGYATTDVRTGDPEAPRQPQTLTTYRYFRGMDGDRNGSGGTKTADVDGITDHDDFAGMLRETVTYNGAAVVERVKNVPWRSSATATNAAGDKARYVAVEKTTTDTMLASGGVRTSEAVTSFDSYGMVSSVNDLGDTATPSDDLCTRTWYARNTSKNILDTVQRTETVAVKCATTPSRPGDVVNDQRFGYDGQSVGTAPTRGRVTSQQEAASYASGAAVYQTIAQTTYDTYGRVTSSADALDRTTTTTYTDTRGLTTRTSISTPDPDGTGSLTPHVTVTDLDPAWGVPNKVTDPAGKVSSATVDALGRLTQVWLPGRVQGTHTPSMKYAYDVRSNGQNAVTTSVLNHDASAYQKTTTIYDGLLRERQTQAPSADRNNAGRVITDKFYDSRGLLEVSNNPWFAEGAPATTLITTLDTVPGSTLMEYDGAGRAVREIFRVHETEKWRTSTAYGGDRVTVDPPVGGTATTTFADVRGNTTRLRQYLSHNPTGDYQDTTYTYDPGARLTGASDPAGNDWTYSYDLRGRQIEASDPDKGVTTSSYDAVGQVLTTTDARGEKLAYTYDSLGRRTSIRDDSASGAVRATWTYDTLVKGQLTRSERVVDAKTYRIAVTGYDDRYQPLGQSVTVPAGHGSLSGTYTTKYSYTADGRIKQVQLPAAGNLGAEKINTFYDSANQAEWMNSVSGGFGSPWGVAVAGSDHSPYGELLRADLGSNFSIMWTQQFTDGARRLDGVQIYREGQSGFDYDATYRYDAAGNVLEIADTPGTRSSDVQCFDYDGLRRMTEAWTPTSGDCSATPTTSSIGGAAKYWNSYRFDAVGNRTQLTERGTSTTTSTYTYPSAGTARPHATTQVVATGTGAGTSTYGYDASGNMTSRGRAGQAAQALSWDAEGELSSVKEGTTTTGKYIYTADGDRLLRTEGSTTTLYLPGGQEVTLTGTTATTKRYLSFEGKTVAVRTAIGASGSTTIVADHHATGTIQVNQANNALTRRYTTPYGESRGTQATWAGDRGFLDKPTDTTGLTAIGARYYDSELGTFISVDPIMLMADPQQWNAYLYSNSNPVTHSDPTGLMYDGWTASYRYTHQGKGGGVMEKTVVTKGPFDLPEAKSTNIWKVGNPQTTTATEERIEIAKKQRSEGVPEYAGNVPREMYGKEPVPTVEPLVGNIALTGSGCLGGCAAASVGYDFRHGVYTYYGWGLGPEIGLSLTLEVGTGIAPGWDSQVAASGGVLGMTVGGAASLNTPSLNPVDWRPDGVTGAGGVGIGWQYGGHVETGIYHTYGAK